MYKIKTNINDMQNISKTHDGKCLSKKYKGSHIKLEWECKEHHRWWSKPYHIKQGSWCPKCGTIRTGNKTRSTIEKMQNMAKLKNGKCLSTVYINAKTKLLWECEFWHKWKATPNRIQQGSWCPKCGVIRAGNKIRLTIEEMHKLAKSRGGKCLSEVYIDTHTKLYWECSEGHKWWAIAGNVKYKAWCPYCAGFHKTIEQMQEIAESHGGNCLSKEYNGTYTKLHWKCKEGHQWWAVPSDIRRKTWCPTCGFPSFAIRCGHIFEALCMEIFLSLGITGPGIDSPKYYFIDNNGIRSQPDFILNNNTDIWTDAKLSTYYMNECIEKYSKHCKKLIIIHLKGKRENTPNVKFVPIKNYYKRLISIGKQHLVNELEILRKGRIPNRFKRYKEQNLNGGL